MEEQTPTVSLISCMHFVRRGIAKAVPEKVGNNYLFKYFFVIFA